jgi:hypothetical protein
MAMSTPAFRGQQSFLPTGGLVNDSVLIVQDHVRRRAKRRDDADHDQRYDQRGSSMTYVFA